MTSKGNPYYGHTLGKRLEQVRNFHGEDIGRAVFMDYRYRGHKHMERKLFMWNAKSGGRSAKACAGLSNANPT
jgi:hypothetical protein